MATANGKITTARLTPGVRILITDDPTKAASDPAESTWRAARVKTGATTATVSGAPHTRSYGRGSAYVHHVFPEEPG